MRNLIFGAALLFGLVTVSSPLQAQSVTFKVCNPGKVDIDVFLLQSGKVSSSHIGPANCAVVAQAKGAMSAGYVGLAFADSHGQWGAAHRVDLLPDLGTGVLSRASQSASVRHGNASVSLPMQLLFKPPAPACRTYQTDSQMANLPFGATSAQRAAAAAADSNRPPDETICEDLEYALNVEAYPDTNEITFTQDCGPCDQKTDAQISPEQRAAAQRNKDAANQVIANVSGMGPLGAMVGAKVDQQNQEDEKERIARERRLKPPQPMNWSDLLTALKRRQSRSIWDVIPRNIIIRGTVSRVDVDSYEDPLEAPGVRWVNIYFRESPDTEGSNGKLYGDFDVCASSPEIFQAVFGADFRTSMIGKAIEVEGESQGADCRGTKGSIRVSLAHQVRLVKSAQFDPGTVPKFVLPPAQPISPVNAGGDGTPEQVDAQKKEFQEQAKTRQKITDCGTQSQQYVKAHPGDQGGMQKAYYACVDAANSPATAPARPTVPSANGASTQAPAAADAPLAPYGSAAAQNKAAQEQQDRIAQQAQQEAKQRDEETKKQARRVACTQQLMKDYPDGGRSNPDAFQKGFLACVQLP